jgi:hypothetical protein
MSVRVNDSVNFNGDLVFDVVVVTFILREGRSNGFQLVSPRPVRHFPRQAWQLKPRFCLTTFSCDAWRGKCLTERRDARPNIPSLRHNIEHVRYSMFPFSSAVPTNSFRNARH